MNVWETKGEKKKKFFAGKNILVRPHRVQPMKPTATTFSRRYASAVRLRQSLQTISL